MLKKKFPLSYRHVFPHLSQWEKVSLGPLASRDEVIPLFGHYENCLQHPALIPGRQTCSALTKSLIKQTGGGDHVHDSPLWTFSSVLTCVAFVGETRKSCVFNPLTKYQREIQGFACFDCLFIPFVLQTHLMVLWFVKTVNFPLNTCIIWCFSIQPHVPFYAPSEKCLWLFNGFPFGLCHSHNPRRPITSQVKLVKV